jgi:hypothetical protein
VSTPASRVELFYKLKPLGTEECPFANLPEKHAGRWGAGLTAAKMGRVPVATPGRPVLVAQFELSNGRPTHLRHSRFIALLEDKNPRMCGGNEASGLGCPRCIDFLRVVFKYRADVCQPRLEAAEIDVLGMFGDYLFSEELLAILCA